VIHKTADKTLPVSSADSTPGKNCAESQGATFMPPQRGTETEQLFQIIEVIQLGRKTGVLYVERDVQARVETGRLQFNYGQISDARAGQYEELSGVAAMRWLRTWERCRFFFLAADALPSAKAMPEQGTQPLMSVNRKELSPISRESGSPPRPSITRTDVPRLARPVEQGLALVEQAGLSRTYRHLLLLIDGKRSSAELARLTGRKPDDLQLVLNVLARLGIIY
jgi:hypothetical protein